MSKKMKKIIESSEGIKETAGRAIFAPTRPQRSANKKIKARREQLIKTPGMMQD